MPRFKYAVFPFTVRRSLGSYRATFMAGVFQCGPHRNHAAIVKWCHFQEVTAPTVWDCNFWALFYGSKAGCRYKVPGNCEVSQSRRYFSPEVEQMRNRVSGNGGETKINNPSKPSGYCMHRTVVIICNIRLSTKKFYVLPTRCIYVFWVDLRTNSYYFTVQHWLIGSYNWDGVCLLRGTFYILRSAHTVYLCVLCGSENKRRLFHCTALTDWLL